MILGVFLCPIGEYRYVFFSLFVLSPLFFRHEYLPPNLLTIIMEGTVILVCLLVIFRLSPIRRVLMKRLIFR
jgi:hypothetical protein